MSKRNFGHSIWIIAQPKKGEGANDSKGSASFLESPLVQCLFYLWISSFTVYAFYRASIFKILWHYIKKMMS